MSSPSVSSEDATSPVDNGTSTSPLSSENMATAEQKVATTHVSSNILPEPHTLSQPEADASKSAVTIEAPSMTGVDLKEFRLFPKLPPELRVRVWKYTFPGPRLVPAGSLFTSMKSYALSKMPPTPVALHVNSESRHEALKSYELCFAWRRDRRDGIQLYVNYDKDIFFSARLFAILRLPNQSSITETGETTMSGSASNFQIIVHSHFRTKREKPLHKIKRLLIDSEKFYEKIAYRDEVAEWECDFGMSALKELLVVGAEPGKPHCPPDCPETEFVERKVVDKLEVDAKGEGDYQWLKENPLVIQMQKCKEENPNWKAPILIFGEMVDV